MSEIVRISPHRLRYTLDCLRDLPIVGVQDGDWDTVRSRLDVTDKFRGVVQHFRDGLAWEDTDLFRNIYQVRLDRGETPRGCSSIAELADQYRARVDALYLSMERHGFVERIGARPVPLPNVYLARDGEVLLGNNGNHRVAIAQVLDLPHVFARVEARHPEAPPLEADRVTVAPELHTGALEIPAMTTPEERLAYYQLALRQAKQGAVVELGTWLGAATAYLAAGVRDAGAVKAGRVHTFDRFKWQAIHEYKAGQALTRSMVEQVRINLDDLIRVVEIHEGEIARAAWDPSQPISLLVADGPKRVAEIASTLAIFGPAMAPGSWMAWQDFAYFPAYDLPACFTQLEDAGRVRFVEGIYPGTTAVFHVEAAIGPQDGARLSLKHIRTADIVPIWERWRDRLPEGIRGRFMCGAAFFLSDRNEKAKAGELFRSLVAQHREDIGAKWEYFRQKRPQMLTRYPELARELAA